MPIKCPKCQVERRSSSNSYGWCKKCFVAHNMMKLIINEYIESSGKPDRRMSLMMTELDFLYKRNTQLFGYLNTAIEVCFSFVLGNERRLDITDIKELNYSSLPPNEILNLLEKALLIKREDGNIIPNKIVDRLKDLRLAEIPIRSDEFHAAMTETIGLIAVSLTKALFEIYGVDDNKYNKRFPRSAMAVLHLLAFLIIEAEEKNKPINEKLALKKYFELMAKMLTARQRKIALYHFVSFVDGRARILKDFDSDNKVLIIDEVVINFLERIRELMREYERDRGS